MVRNNIGQIVFTSLIILLSSPIVFAQLIENSNTMLYEEYLLDNDQLDNYTGGYYVINKTDSVKWQSPTAAFFKSMIFPGWGQLSNRQYIKAGIVIGVEGIFLGTMIKNFKKTSDAKKAFDLAFLTDDNDLKQRTFDEYDKFKDRRNLYTWFSGAFIFLSMFDAYVDAHMAHFPKYDKQKISLRINSGNKEEVKAVLALNF